MAMHNSILPKFSTHERYRPQTQTTDRQADLRYPNVPYSHVRVKLKIEKWWYRIASSVHAVFDSWCCVLRHVYLCFSERSVKLHSWCTACKVAHIYSHIGPRRTLKPLPTEKMDILRPVYWNPLPTTETMNSQRHKHFIDRVQTTLNFDLWPRNGNLYNSSHSAIYVEIPPFSTEIPCLKHELTDGRTG